MSRPPDFDELVGGDLAPEERARLERVHELLVEAGPPPDLTPELAAVPSVTARGLLPRRRRVALAFAASALALGVFGAGFLVGDLSDDPPVERVIPMVGAGGAAAARASIQLLPADEAGNWPMKLLVRGLPELPKGERYELWLTRGKTAKVSCGSFVVGEGTTEVLLNAPYRLRDFDGWIVTGPGSNEPLLQTV